MKIYSLALVLLFTTNICAQTTTKRSRTAHDEKLWNAGAVLLENTALWSVVFLVGGHLAYSQVDAGQRLKWGAIFGTMIGLYKAAGKYNEISDSGSNLTSDQKQPQLQTEPTSVGN